jgi:hypothetical protein
MTTFKIFCEVTYLMWLSSSYVCEWQTQLKLSSDH